MISGPSQLRPMTSPARAERWASIAHWRALASATPGAGPAGWGDQEGGGGGGWLCGGGGGGAGSSGGGVGRPASSSGGMVLTFGSSLRPALCRQALLESPTPGASCHALDRTDQDPAGAGPAFGMIGPDLPPVRLGGSGYCMPL